MSVTSRLGAAWISIGETLGIDVVAPYRLTLPLGVLLDAVAFLRHFGGSKGMIVVTDYETVRAHLAELDEAGYGFSVLEEPKPDEPLIVSEYIALLQDWGWTGQPEDEPDWMRYDITIKF